MEEKLKAKIGKKVLVGTGIITAGIIASLLIDNNSIDTPSNADEHTDVTNNNTNVGVDYSENNNVDHSTNTADGTYTETEKMFIDNVISDTQHEDFAKENLGETYEIINSLGEHSVIIKDILDNKKINYSQEELALVNGDVYSYNRILHGTQRDNTGKYTNLDIRAEYKIAESMPYTLSIRVNSKINGDTYTMETIKDIGNAIGLAYNNEDLAGRLASNMNSEFTYNGKKYNAVVFTEQNPDGNYVNFVITEVDYILDTSIDFILSNVEKRSLFKKGSIRMDNLNTSLNEYLKSFGTSIKSIDRLSINKDALSEELVLNIVTTNDKNLKISRTKESDGTEKYGFDIGINSMDNSKYIELVTRIAKDLFDVDINKDKIVSDDAHKVYYEDENISIFALEERIVVASQYSKYTYGYSEVYNVYGYDNPYESELNYEIVDYEEFGTTVDTSPVEGFEHEIMRDIEE